MFTGSEERKVKEQREKSGDGKRWLLAGQKSYIAEPLGVTNAFGDRPEGAPLRPWKLRLFPC